MNTKFNFAKTLLLMGFFAFSFQANAQEKVIAQDELPKTARNFITKHFSDQKPVQIVKDVDYLVKTEYEIRLDSGFQLEFDNKGNWKDIDGNDTVIPTGFIPKSITDYVSKNFPTQKLTGIEKKSSGYELELTNGLDLDFNAEGAFVRIDD